MEMDFIWGLGVICRRVFGYSMVLFEWVYVSLKLVFNFESLEVWYFSIRLIFWLSKYLEIDIWK